MSRKNEIVLRTYHDVMLAIRTLTGVGVNAQEPEWTFSLKPFENDASAAQLRLFHMWGKVIADDTGTDKAWVKIELKRKFFPLSYHTYKDPVTKEKKTVEVIPSIMDMKKKELAEAMNQIVIWAQTDLNITLPLPEDLRWALEAERK